MIPKKIVTYVNTPAHGFLRILEPFSISIKCKATILIISNFDNSNFSVITNLLPLPLIEKRLVRNISKMVNKSQTAENSFTNGCQNGQGETSPDRFFFTSESVGEGHPGKCVRN